MATNIARRAATENLRVLLSASISGTYSAIGTYLLNPARILVFENLTDQTVLISDDGVNDKFVLPAGGLFVLDLSANAIIDGYFYSEGTTFYAKNNGVATTMGGVYLSAIYGRIS